MKSTKVTMWHHSYIVKKIYFLGKLKQVLKGQGDVFICLVLSSRESKFKYIKFRIRHDAEKTLNPHKDRNSKYLTFFLIN